MNEREYNEKSLTGYLLGSLPSEQVEKFDEWSFTDEDFSTALKVAEIDLIDAYLHKELRGADLERFNSHYLSSARRRKKVNFAKSLQIHAEKNIAPESLEAKTPIETKFAEKTGFFASWRLFANPVFGLAAAAALVLLIVGLGGFWISRKINPPETEIVSNGETPSPSNIELPAGNENTGAAIQKTPDSENSSPRSEKEKINKTPVVESSPLSKPEKTAISPKVAVASFILTPPLRGENQPPKISFPKETTLILITLKTESDDYKSYRVALIDESNKKIWQRGNVRIRNEAINFSFPANLLKTRIYSIIVSGVRDDGEVEVIANYSFRAAPK